MLRITSAGMFNRRPRKLFHIGRITSDSDDRGGAWR
jgi:hypothetical protein